MDISRFMALYKCSSYYYYSVLLLLITCIDKVCISIVFRLNEVGKDVLVAPSRTSHFLPLIKVMPAPSCVDQIIDAPTASESLSSGDEGLLAGEKNIKSLKSSEAYIAIMAHG